jgi:hypothetical protein
VSFTSARDFKVSGRGVFEKIIISPVSPKSADLSLNIYSNFLLRI